MDKRWNLGLEYKHGQTVGEDRVWVGRDGIARLVSPDLFDVLETMIERSSAHKKEINRRIAEDDPFGNVEKVASFVEKSRAKIDALSDEEINRIINERSL